MPTQYLDLGSLLFRPPQTAGSLTVVPLVRPGSPSPAYEILGKALANRSVEITEISEGGSVPELLFRNGGAKPVLLLDGEELVGAKQNRVLNLTVLAPAKADIRIPVSCIEQGRWHWRSRHFEAANRTLYASARREKMAAVSRSMRQERSHRSDQSALWDSIAVKAGRFGVHSATGAASDIYEDRMTVLDRMVRDIHPLPDQVGAAFAVGGQLIGAEIFDSAQTFRDLLPKLIRSYGLDAIDWEYPVPTDKAPDPVDVEGLLKRLEGLPAFTRSGLGLGEDLRFEDDGVVGAALAHEGRLVHLSVFTKDNARERVLY